MTVGTKTNSNYAEKIIYKVITSARLGDYEDPGKQKRHDPDMSLLLSPVSWS